MTPKTKWILGVAGIAGIFLLVWVIRRENPNNAVPKPLAQPVPRRSETVPLSNSKPFKSPAARAADFTEEEKEELAIKFKEKFKPAVEKWCEAYSGRIPFTSDDVTLDKFHSRLGVNLYTFMISANTLTIQSPIKGATKVFYMTTGDSLKKMNSLPEPGTVPDLTLPVNREEVIRMVKADSGVEFKPNECVIKPTGISGGLNGGASVHMLPAGSDPNNGAASKIDLVFGPDGKLVYYDRDPFF